MISLLLSAKFEQIRYAWSTSVFNAPLFQEVGASDFQLKNIIGDCFAMHFSNDVVTFFFQFHK